MQTFNQLTLEVADIADLKGLKVFRYNNRLNEELYFSVLPYAASEIFIASYNADMTESWITTDLEEFGQPIL